MFQFSSKSFHSLAFHNFTRQSVSMFHSGRQSDIFGAPCPWLVPLMIQALHTTQQSQSSGD